MEIAILGLPRSGKSTLFQIMTGIKSREMFGEKCVRGIAKVPDVRFDRLVEIFQPEKITPAVVPFVDVNAMTEKEWDSVRQQISSADSILHIVDAFSTDDLPEIVGRYRKLEEELIFSDLVVVDRRIERLSKLPQKTLKGDDLIHIKLMPELKKHLEGGTPLRGLDLSNEEINAIKNFSFWSLRPELIILNVAEGMSGKREAFFEATKTPVLEICCEIESEIASLPPEDQKEFLDSHGIQTPAFEHIIQTAFSQLERIYYFTVGKDEVRAWVIKKSSTAPQAAAAIHKDFERGFIKAEIVSYDEFMNAGGSLNNAKSRGKMRLEGKEYIVLDGDIISFRFNV